MDPSAQIAVVVAVAVLILSWMFRAPLKAIIGQLRKVTFPGGSAELADGKATKQVEAQQKGSEPVQSTALTVKPAPEVLLDSIEADLRRTLEAASAGSQEIQLSWALRAAAVAQLERHHEETYRLIFGSQIKTLQAINVNGQLTVGQSRYFYDVASNSFPDFYVNYQFEAWGNFLVGRGLVRLAEGIANDGTAVFLTPRGKHFLMCMTAWGLSDAKAG